MRADTSAYRLRFKRSLRCYRLEPELNRTYRVEVGQNDASVDLHSRFQTCDPAETVDPKPDDERIIREISARKCASDYTTGRTWHGEMVQKPPESGRPTLPPDLCAVGPNVRAIFGERVPGRGPLPGVAELGRAAL